MLVLLLLTLRAQQHGCKEGSRFEACEEYIQCLADPPSCTELVIADDLPPYVPVRSINISGTIPSAIGTLTALSKLIIAENGVNGTIPETIGLLTNLKYLRLASAPVVPGPRARLSGTLPLSLGNLVRLEKLYVYQTQISGTLPLSLGELTELHYMNIFSNSVTGVIPESIFKLTPLIVLDLSDNYLSGTLSENIGELSALADLTLSINYLSGTVPDTFAALTSLAMLYLRSNSFTAVGGGICAIQENLEIACDLSDNEIPGTVGETKNCPVCLNNGKCDKHNQSPGRDQPIFPNKVCDFTRSTCSCWAASPVAAPTLAPTAMSHAAHSWKPSDTTLTIMIVVLIAACVAVLALTFVTVGIHTLGGQAFTNRCCWCYTPRGREEHERRTAQSAPTVAAQTDSTLEAPFLNGVAVQGVPELYMLTEHARRMAETAAVQTDSAFEAPFLLGGVEEGAYTDLAAKE